MLKFLYFAIPLSLSVGMVAATESILPPGARSIDIKMVRERPKKPLSQKAFERRLLSPAGKGRLE